MRILILYSLLFKIFIKLPQIFFVSTFFFCFCFAGTHLSVLNLCFLWFEWVRSTGDRVAAETSGEFSCNYRICTLTLRGRGWEIIGAFDTAYPAWGPRYCRNSANIINNGVVNRHGANVCFGNFVVIALNIQMGEKYGLVEKPAYGTCQK